MPSTSPPSGVAAALTGGAVIGVARAWPGGVVTTVATDDPPAPPTGVEAGALTGGGAVVAT
ncbi:MAG TPA: SDR family NAD(P)-dependent oxidoreductase, partial [Acidimicrobiia bacterium]|nr:SDR family NAD(P)-dependent oxidoreductase [Acidimicrobiia bacterium]